MKVENPKKFNIAEGEMQSGLICEKTQLGTVALINAYDKGHTGTIADLGNRLHKLFPRVEIGRRLSWG